MKHDQTNVSETATVAPVTKAELSSYDGRFERRCRGGCGWWFLKLFLRFSTLRLPPLGHHHDVWRCSPISMWRNWYPPTGARHPVSQCGLGPVDVEELQWKRGMLVWPSRWWFRNHRNGLPVLCKRALLAVSIWPEGQGFVQPCARRIRRWVGRPFHVRRDNCSCGWPLSTSRKRRLVSQSCWTEECLWILQSSWLLSLPQQRATLEIYPQQELCLLSDWLPGWLEAAILLNVALPLSHGYGDVSYGGKCS